MDYKEQLTNILWLKKRAEILERDEYKCQKCGETSNLQVHHLKYINGRFAWEYDNSDLITLCQKCHNTEHNDNDGRMFIHPNKMVMFRSLIKDHTFTPVKKILRNGLIACIYHLTKSFR